MTNHRPPATAEATEIPVALFVDYSNLWVGARDTAPVMRESASDLRIDARRLYELMADGREVAVAVLVANVRTPKPVLDHFAEYFDVITVEAGRESGAEQAADEVLQNRILLAATRPEPGTMVIVTGDGAGARRGIGFQPTIGFARDRGWGIELLAFGRSLNDELRRLVLGCGVVVSLETYYYSFTFVEFGRRPQRASLGYRERAVPRRRSAWAVAA